ncbi:SDR family NAD(P)-dependent oxidoreductase [Arenibacter sp. GZD96]|uniref:SDR family NAD(P)-dependent oxidoreductase n=1 Tax=Aurantibrevibacter litoralis TaxID=3106030 RepID=UPI002AFE23FB|nr:SDR family NAD(P)-dependent oxidoreductase [Arenibacter sp. GZD-96]MEA1785989.1 SDR family NAD(P)-dependent oxidoreductase [Arenibacter sp. GZD-96]
MNQQWQHKTAVITGAASGLGKALTQQLLLFGVKVAALDINKDILNPSFFGSHEQVFPYVVDLVDETAVKQAFEDFYQNVSRIDILVNCAGITGVTNIKSHEVALADFNRVMAINVVGTFNSFKAVVPHMLRNNYGRVLHVASIAGKDGNAGMLAYSTSKAAVIGMTKVQGKEYAETGIRINAIAPAVIQTEMLDGMPQSQISYMTDKIPMKRCGTLEEFVNAACFIISDDNSFSTGFTFDLSGGRALY